MRKYARYTCLFLLAATAAQAQLVREAPPPAAPPPEPVVGVEPADSGWTQTLERIAQSVVAIQVDQTRAFDTEWNNSSQATGFVVDAERGLVLTNRHVVTPGPVIAEATFLNREEVQLYPVYRDPVHDFGIYRYDPSKLRFIKPKALPLYPQGAEVGREIRVVGNNAGEQLSILAGTLARLDRQAPEYGVGKYNDFNTFYLQAASGTSGGSSGSPVIDIQGRVVALNAGGSSAAASSFYLPLGRVKRALELIQAGKPVPRGTLQTTFIYTPFDELRRLGLQPSTEAAVRKAFPDYTGMLVVAQVQPGSGAAAALQPGDVLVRVNGKFLTQFEPLNAVLDDHVGAPIELELQRGGAIVSAKLTVDDLRSITPDEYLEFGEAVVNTLSYQMARHMNVPVRGAFVANPGYALGASGVPRGAVITAVNGTSIAGIADLEQAIAKLGDGDRTTVRYSTIDDPNGSQLRSVRMDRRWFPAQRCKRNDATGYWDCRALAAGPPPKAPAVSSTVFQSVADAHVARVVPSLVQVTFDMPYAVAGVTERNYHGTGLVVDAARGLVVVDRNTVPVSLGDVSVTFAGTLEVPGRVVFVHPLHNYSIVQYDPTLIGTTPVRSARLGTKPLRPGDEVTVVGLSADTGLKTRTASVADLDPIALPLSRTMQFRESNLETIDLVNGPQDFDGVLLDKSGAVAGMWSSFASESGREVVQQNLGVPIDVIADMLERVHSGRAIYSLEAELFPQPLAAARRLGLGDDWVKKLESANSGARRVLTVTRLVGGSDAARELQQGDLLLAIDGAVVTRFRDVERAVADKTSVRVTVWRGSAALDLEVRIAALSGIDLTRVVLWAGATLHAPHRAMLAQRGIPPEGVYVAYFAYGSPATRSGLFPGRRIVAVDGQATPDLDSFLKAVTGRPDRASVRLTTIAWNNAPDVITLKLDKHYWPAYELRRIGDAWERYSLE
ncbi:MAG: trypsin-like peptidase domain-containing protein [Steroidobacteraceae bacterium]